MNIKSLKTHDEIAQSFDAFLELRPHLINKEIFVAQVIQQQKEGYEITAVIESDEVAACIGSEILLFIIVSQQYQLKIPILAIFYQ